MWHDNPFNQRSKTKSSGGGAWRRQGREFGQNWKKGVANIGGDLHVIGRLGPRCQLFISIWQSLQNIIYI